MGNIIIAGGWLMCPIILCSISLVAISIERLWVLQTDKIAPKNQLIQVWEWVKNDQIDVTRLRELQNSSELGKILAAGLSNAQAGQEAMKISIQDTANQVIHAMGRYLSFLGTLAAISPLLGLLGTVIGMIKVFISIELEGVGNADRLAGGISEALITTASGLAVAIPAIIMHRFLTRKIDTLTILMEQESTKLIEAIYFNRKIDSNYLN